MLETLTKLDPKSFAGAIARLPLRFIPRGHVITVRRGINKGRRWVVGSSIHGCWLGTYEYEKQALVSRLLRPGMTAWDVGANAGFYTLAFSRLVGDAGKVYAFEPFAENTNNLLTHLRLNNIKNTHIVQVALSEYTGLIGFSVAASNSMGHLTQQDSTYIVPAFAVDDFLASFPEARPDLLKIDIEGVESLLLSGACKLLRDSAPEIVLALHDETQSHRCAELLHSHGYSLYYLNGLPADSFPLKSDEIYARKRSATQPAVPADNIRPSGLA